MTEYIDKQDAIDIFKQFKKRKWISMPIEQVIEIISVVPYVEAEPIRHGHWIDCKGSNGKDYHKCSECLHTQDITGLLNYCPNCGARMDEVEK